MEYFFHPTQDNIVINQLHFITPSPGIDFNEPRKGIRKALKKFGCTSAILSSFTMSKYKCITKEAYDEEYKKHEAKKIKGPFEGSVGDDLETFIEMIKNGEINNTNRGDSALTFLHCLLDKEERKKLEQKDYDFMKTFVNIQMNERRGVDAPEAEWNGSEYNMKFSRSSCHRATHFIDA